MILTSEILFASLGIEHHFVNENQRRIHRCNETQYSVFLYEMEAVWGENQQQSRISICACWAYRRLSGFFNHNSFAICISNREINSTPLSWQGKGARESCTCEGAHLSPSFLHDRFYFIVWNLKKSLPCEKPWINTNEVWRRVQMVGNKKYKKDSKVSWSLLPFKRPNNLGVFVTPIVLLLSHCMVPHLPAVVSERKQFQVLSPWQETTYLAMCSLFLDATLILDMKSICLQFLWCCLTHRENLNSVITSNGHEACTLFSH